jgi:ABC-2 type transport system ATP-binding protein
VLVSAISLAKQYGDNHAVADLSFQLEPGHVTGFLGPNGAGKSTALRLMLGLVRGSGQTLYGGKPLVAHAPGSAVVGAHLDPRSFHPKRKARAHLEMLASAWCVPSQRVSEVIDLVGLGSVQHDRPSQYSLGMTQRLGLAAAIIPRPAVLIVDEPTNGLDAQAIHWLRTFLRGYAEQGNVVFVSSHLMNEMQVLADRIIILAQGKLVADEDITTLLRRPGMVLVSIRTDDNSRLLALLAGSGIGARVEGERLIVDTVSTEVVGALAQGAGLQIRELGLQEMSLESVFLQLTEGQESFALQGGSA